MTAVKQRAMNIISMMPDAEVEKFVSMNIRFEKRETEISDRLQKMIDDDIEKTQKAITAGCEMLSIEESYNSLREKYGF